MLERALSVEVSERLGEKTLYEVLRSLVEAVFVSQGSLSNHKAGKTAFESLLTRIQTSGTGLTFVSDVKAFTGELEQQLRNCLEKKTCQDTQNPYRLVSGTGTLN